MGKAIYLIVIMAFITGCQGKTEKEENQDTDQEMVVAPENVELISIDIEGMTCTGCENTIKGGISELEGIVEVTASHVDGNATVKYDKSRASIDQMKGAIEKKGYTVVGHETILE
jgi:copper chaperone CopZ